MTKETLNSQHKLELTATPHVRTTMSTQRAMWFVVASLLPCLISAVVFFGTAQLAIIAVSVGVAVLSEALVKKIRKQDLSVNDGSAVITGLLLALILPPNFNLFFTGIGSAVAILIGKELFGGLGYNIFNPALVGRAFLQGAFPVQMTTWHNPEYVVDSLTQASPLALFKFADATQKAGFDFTSYLDDMLIGNIQGSLGETSGLAIIIAGVFLIAMGIVNWRIPVSMILGVIIFAGILHLIDPARVACPGYHLLAGGFLFGAVFMATDWVTSPLTSKGMWIFGLSLAFLIVAIRSYGGLPEGVMYAILIMNGAVPLINRYTRPEIFGVKK